MSALNSKPLLRVNHLSVQIGAGRPVDDVSFEIKPGETFALLGESGCGKSMTALAVMRLLPPAAQLTAGSVTYGDEELLALTEAEMRAVRGGGMGMIFQEPATSLNPVMSIGRQIEEVLDLHLGLRGAPARQRARELLEAVGLPEAERRLDEYPFQLSGGMKQRAMIAMALAGEPELLIADEPTTALDV
ncbi:MAG: ABC transporter ATP-binding protein, partial [Rhodocyclaceae bacterium]|nr:ABC transporter ATP-binding protein [Rhodocyclaceae bacterium]